MAMSALPLKRPIAALPRNVAMGQQRHFAPQQKACDFGVSTAQLSDILNYNETQTRQVLTKTSPLDVGLSFTYAVADHAAEAEYS